MTTIIGLAGSLRRDSFNASLLRAAAQLAPADSTIEVTSIRGIPLYDGDIESSEGIPESVTALKERIVAADGLIIATPEYNNSLPGPAKNAIDWLSRPPADIARVFRDRPVAVIGASPGGLGTVLSQSAWLPVLRTLGMRPWFGARLQVARAGTVFDKQGVLVDDKLREQVSAFVNGFIEFVRR